MTIRGTILVILAIGLLLMAHFKQLYFITDRADGQLIWNVNQADVFLREVTLGYRVSYLAYPLEGVQEILYHVPSPDKRRSNTIIMELTDSKVHRIDINYTNITSIEQVNGDIFAATEAGLLRWAGSRFIPASTQEKEQFKRGVLASYHGPDYDSVNGWSARSSILGGEQHRYRIQLSRSTLALDVRGHFDRDLSIDVLRPGQARETIWHLSERPRWVSKAEYQEVFGKR
jgi:hypothetical protein